MHAFSQRLTACMILSLKEGIKEISYFFKLEKAKQITIQPSPEILSSTSENSHCGSELLCAVERQRIPPTRYACRIVLCIPAFYYIVSASTLLEGTWKNLARALSSSILKCFNDAFLFFSWLCLEEISKLARHMAIPRVVEGN